MSFVYSAESQKELVKYLSSERLTKYLIHTDGDVERALKLYEHNTRLSEAYYGVLQSFEIAVRNSIHWTMVMETQHEDWYDYTHLEHREQLSIGEAKTKVQRWGKVVTPGRVIAEFTFGFWVRLMAPAYEKRLWVKHLHKAFPHQAKPDRRRTFDRLEEIRKVRNRVAHHEPIFERNLKEDYFNLMQALGWICPVTAAWVDSTNALARLVYK